jgi:hypothetical protein
MILHHDDPAKPLLAELQKSVEGLVKSSAGFGPAPVLAKASAPIADRLQAAEALGDWVRKRQVDFVIIAHDLEKLEQLVTDLEDLPGPTPFDVAYAQAVASGVDPKTLGADASWPN